MDLSDPAFFPNQTGFSVCTQHWISTKAHIVGPDDSLRRLSMSVIYCPCFLFFDAYLTSLLGPSSAMAPVLGKNESVVLYQQ